MKVQRILSATLLGITLIVLSACGSDISMGDNQPIVVAPTDTPEPSATPTITPLPTRSPTPLPTPYYNRNPIVTTQQFYNRSWSDYDSLLTASRGLLTRAASKGTVNMKAAFPYKAIDECGVIVDGPDKGKKACATQFNMGSISVEINKEHSTPDRTAVDVKAKMIEADFQVGNVSVTWVDWQNSFIYLNHRVFLVHDGDLYYIDDIVVTG